MTPSPFLIQLAILLLPGVLWTHLETKFASKTKPTQVEYLARTLLFGLASYVVTYVVFWAVGHEFTFVDFTQVDKANVITRAIAIQIAVATCIGLVLSVLWMYAINWKLMARILQTIKATKSYGDEDVWDFVFNSGDAAAEYVHVRDFENKIVYAGWVNAFSESGRLRELALVRVQVFNFEGDLLFETPRVYISRKTEGLHIEFPATSENITNGAKS
ncbi:DUF6338 family protein [Mesorhizobium sp. Pch-S]|uniref:DUF6338 family protein n=1 Tax=Mesorhizobium sp. Pch-S TaxID=2082387 RepID=UPI001010B115|nr:DUF6338 family protein [Mesorhizobium sp. Pch-S]QAZ45965.1 hypothetical protein C1M53_26645 [Mesorhizobium sp. Pch-S]